MPRLENVWSYELCPQILNYGVRFFGIGFRLGDTERGYSVLQDCVFEDNRFFRR